ncbi:oxidoreductase [Rhabdobacter roseus]|uniref:Uncharacterized protein YbjT (DUF2867 family) n=1 Tax=Rhabdobacter roseus TaxID=1655419 RepID=A0A840TPZ8_9BACT|nr:NAD(P)H-binding protein [Rhabdobacter roseus]MBB5283797.1 uncharacterized protein YbjT (DUF2867 family) [Rhabdobacter roseus]
MVEKKLKTALLVGATGLIGQQVLELLLQSPHYTQVKVLVRRPLGIPPHKKLEEIVYNFDAPNADLVEGDDVFCCLGTTMKKAGSKEAFRRVDQEYPVQVGTFARQKGAQKYLIVTAMGADAEASLFYNRVKGEVEEELMALGYPTLHVLRPSLLLGKRKETRLGEKVGEGLAKVFGPLLLGPLRKYRAIDSAKVARAMVELAQKKETGVFIHLSDSLQKY